MYLEKAVYGHIHRMNLKWSGLSVNSDIKAMRALKAANHLLCIMVIGLGKLKNLSRNHKLKTQIKML